MSDSKSTVNQMTLASEPGQAVGIAVAAQKPRESEQSVPAGSVGAANSQDTGTLVSSESTMPIEEVDADILYTRGPTPQWIQFLVPTGDGEAQWMPSTALLHDKKAGVQFTIVDRPVAAKLRFLTDVDQNKVSQGKADKDKVGKDSCTCLDFNLHASNDPQETWCVLGLWITEQYEKNNGGLCAIDVEFHTTGGISHRLYRDPGFDENPESGSIWNYMRSLTKAASSTQRTVKFRIVVDSSKVSMCGALLCALRDLSNSLPRNYAWAPYCLDEGSGYPLVMRQNSRALVKKRWGQQIVPFIAQNYFYDLDHYLAVMAYATAIESEQRSLQLNRIQGLPVNISILSVNPKVVVLAQVRTLRYIDDVEKILGSMAGGVQLKLWAPYAGHLQGPIAKGYISVNTWSRSSGRMFHIKITDYSHSFFSNCLSFNASCHGWIFFSTPGAIIMEKLAALEILKHSGVARSGWGPLLLNHEPTALPDVDLLKGVARLTISLAKADLRRRLRPWHEVGMRAVDALRSAKGGCLLVQGGARRRALLVALALFFAACDFNVFLVGETHVVVEELFEEHQRLLNTPYIVHRAPVYIHRSHKVGRVLAASAANGKRTIVIADRDAEAHEASALIPLLASPYVVGTIRGADPTRGCARGSDSNEFGEQLGKSLFDRLRAGGHPCIVLP
ncbi:uncharacterized protein DSM5745_04329 [Aspergillus mulundensis]|uniref:Uncharacterized protein n=1 Tax=Aspergillus mulundensis TaxID=1810919 RepID=A0A3D8SCJ7_9EURO|nr:hypothetical protein DSM5745_04329 [Aspergillus mulundensis]RDW84003.1 hypothetical protein DSM5745_04329 [Aspergillus mulundensis]